MQQHTGLLQWIYQLFISERAGIITRDETLEEYISFKNYVYVKGKGQ